MNAKQKKCSILVFLLIGLLCTKAGYAETLLYKITASDKESDRKTVISKVENGYLVKSSNSLDKDESTFRTDLSFSILEWNLRSPGRGINVSAKRMNNIISVTGQIRDKQINEKFEIDSLPWYQEWGWGLRTHIISEKDTLPFWSLNSNFQQIAKFEAKKEKPEMFDLNGQKIESVHVKVRLAGARRFFWSGDMWFRKSDGEFVCSKMTNGPAGPVTTIQLINEG